MTAKEKLWNFLLAVGGCVWSVCILILSFLVDLAWHRDPERTKKKLKEASE